MVIIIIFINQPTIRWMTWTMPATPEPTTEVEEAGSLKIYLVTMLLSDFVASPMMLARCKLQSSSKVKLNVNMW